jgi:hypothetical protein
MKKMKKTTIHALLTGAVLWALPAIARAWEPGEKEIDAAVKSADFAGYLNGATTWLNGKLPANADHASLTALLKDPVFHSVLDQRQFIAKTTPEKLAAFAKADPANQAFLSWLMKNTEALDLYLIAVVPLGLPAREDNSYMLSTEALGIWNKIMLADPDAKQGIYLKLAIATGLLPPGSVNIGAGGAKTPSDVIERFKHYKTAHQNKELFPSFDHLTVWEYTKIVNSGASNEDLAWGRKMINTWRPDLKKNELVVNSTSEVWRRNSPIDFAGTFKNVLAGGGKCGPRSSWSVFICHAFGIPAIGVGQPAHACVAYKTAFPMAEPQPGSAWKVGYGRGWQVSKLEGMGGTEFIAAVQEREHAAEFSQVEHLRWFAAATPAAKDKIMAVANKIRQDLQVVKTDITASAKADEAEKELVPDKNAATQAVAAAGPIKVAASSTVLEASKFTTMLAARTIDCFTGGKQVNFDKSIDNSFIEFNLDVATAGSYTVQVTAATPNMEQVLNVSTGSNPPVTIKVVNSNGLWEKTEAAEVKLEKGAQTLKIAAPNQRGMALKSIELKAK